METRVLKHLNTHNGIIICS